MSGYLALHLGHMRQRSVPAPFKLARHQPVGGIRGVILPKGPVGGIARRFEIATKGLADLIPSFSGFLGGSGSSGDGAGAATGKS